MAVQVTKDAIDIGIITRDAGKMLGFYRDLLGFEHVATIPMAGGTVMERLMVGSSVLKLVIPGSGSPADAPGGGFFASYGLRYWTVTIANLDETLAACEAAGHTIAMPRTEARPGVVIGIVQDPEGNLVEFIQGG